MSMTSSLRRKLEVFVIVRLFVILIRMSGFSKELRIGTTRVRNISI